MRLTLDEIGALATAARDRRRWSSAPEWIMVKVAEEVGEVARALGGEAEGRPGRGDLTQEVAQSVILLTVLLHVTRPTADLDDAVRAELVALQALAE